MNKNLTFTIEGFQQQELVRLKYDTIDAHILRYIVDFEHSEKMYKTVTNKHEYFWVLYQTIADSLPILYLKKRAIAARFDKYVKDGILEKKVKKGIDKYSQNEKFKERIGTFTYFRFITTGYSKLIEYNNDTNVVETAAGMSLEQHDGCRLDNSSAVVETATKDSSLIDPSNIDPSINNPALSAEIIPTLDHIWSLNNKTKKGKQKGLYTRIFDTFYYYYSDIYPGEKILYNQPKFTGCIKALTKTIELHYNSEDRLYVTKQKIDRLMIIAKKRDKYKNWRFTPFVLSNKWNDLVEEYKSEKKEIDFDETVERFKSMVI